MAKSSEKTQRGNGKPHGKVLKSAAISQKSRGIGKAKSKLKAKNTRAQIEKLNSDMAAISEIRSSLAAQGDVSKKTINALDAKSLKEDFKKDEQAKQASERAEKDLASQLELMTGMAL